MINTPCYITRKDALILLSRLTGGHVGYHHTDEQLRQRLNRESVKDGKWQGDWVIVAKYEPNCQQNFFGYYSDTHRRGQAGAEYGVL